MRKRFATVALTIHLKIQTNVVPKDRSIEPDWAGIARVYAQNKISVAEICERFEVSQSALYSRARDDAWTMRRTTAQGLPSTQARRFGRQVELVDRLYQILESYIKLMEDRVAMPEDLSAADSARESRTMASLVKLLGTLKDLDNRVRAKNEDSNQVRENEVQLNTGDIDAARIREDLAERLARLRKHRDAG